MAEDYTASIADWLAPLDGVKSIWCNLWHGIPGQEEASMVKATWYYMLPFTKHDGIWTGRCCCPGMLLAT
jgi:hypothetical protein